MNFFKIIIFFLLINITAVADLYAVDEKDNSQNIVEKAKEINKEIKKKQANQQSNINSEVNQEEPLPLNDPFAGDASLSGMGGSLGGVTSEDTKNEMSLYNFKLVGIMKGEFVSYVSLINTADEAISLAKSSKSKNIGVLLDTFHPHLSKSQRINKIKLDLAL